MMKRFFLVSLLVLGGYVLSNAKSIEVFVSTKGKSTNTGTQASPIESLETAINILKQKYEASAFTEANIWFESGLYPHSKTVLIDKDLFKGNDVKLTIGKKGNGEVLISGGEKIQSSLFIMWFNTPTLWVGN